MDTVLRAPQIGVYLIRMTSIQLLFPTYIYRARLANKGVQALNRDLVRECSITRQLDDEGRLWSKTRYIGGYTSYASINDLHLRFSTFADLRDLINPHVSNFARAQQWDLQGGRLSMANSWINAMGKGTSHASHLHPLSVVSGVYYAKTPKGAGGIKFEDPRLAQFMAAPSRRAGCSRRNRVHVEEPAREGDLILFDGWLRHEVSPHAGQGERISISFNYDWQ